MIGKESLVIYDPLQIFFCMSWWGKTTFCIFVFFLILKQNDHKIVLHHDEVAWNDVSMFSMSMPIRLISYLVLNVAKRFKVSNSNFSILVKINWLKSEIKRCVLNKYFNQSCYPLQQNFLFSFTIRNQKNDSKTNIEWIVNASNNINESFSSFFYLLALSREGKSNFIP